MCTATSTIKALSPHRQWNGRTNSLNQSLTLTVSAALDQHPVYIIVAPSFLLLVCILFPSVATSHNGNDDEYRDAAAFKCGAQARLAQMCKCQSLNTILPPAKTQKIQIHGKIPYPIAAAVVLSGTTMNPRRRRQTTSPRLID